MTPAHRRYLVLEQGLGAAVINFVLNGGIAALMFWQQPTVPLWGQQSIIVDTVGTTFFLPFLTCLIVTRIAAGQIRAGKLQVLGWTRTSHPQLGWLPESTLRRGLVLGAISMAVVGPLSVIALLMAGIDAMTFWRFVMFKATFAAVLAALVTPLIAVWAIAAKR